MSATSFAASLQNPQGANFRLADVPAELQVVPVNLIAEDGAPSRGLLYRRRDTRPRVGVHLMHPRTDQSQNYNILPLAMAGYAVLGRASRWPNNDVACVHEMLLLDAAAGIRQLQSEGCERIILRGNSGGGSLAAFYQAQAEKLPPNRLKQTPAGDPFDLNRYDLPKADALILVGAHIGQGRLLGKLIDPSVISESDPVGADPSLDVYDPLNGFVTPPASSRFSSEFLIRYREGQIARVARLDALARNLLHQQQESERLLAHASGSAARHLQRVAKSGWHMIVYRTTADPAFVDLSIEPDDRLVFTYISGRPDLENYGENGFARYVTPRAWLSTWSALSSNAGMVPNLAQSTAPLLIVHYAGDAATRISEVDEMLSASRAADKKLTIIPGLDHYGVELKHATGRGQRSTKGTDAVVSWMLERFTCEPASSQSKM